MNLQELKIKHGRNDRASGRFLHGRSWGDDGAPFYFPRAGLRNFVAPGYRFYLNGFRLVCKNKNENSRT